MTIRVGIIILSDKASRGEREDKSGPLLKKLVKEAGWKVEEFEVLPDEKEKLVDLLMDLSDNSKVDLVLTSGGTGLGPRDVTPEATAEAIEKEVPGIAEILRIKGYEQTPRALLSRQLSGTRKGTLIVNLPGGLKAVRQGWELIRGIVPHAVEVLRGRAEECGGE